MEPRESQTAVQLHIAINDTSNHETGVSLDADRAGIQAARPQSSVLTAHIQKGVGLARQAIHTIAEQLCPACHSGGGNAMELMHLSRAMQFCLPSSS